MTDAAMLESFSKALGERRLHMLYQPTVALDDGRLKRVEALVRWDDPERGAVPPSLFVPMAEEHGLIRDLTEWGLEAVLRQWTEWRDSGLDTSVAFNISALSLEKLDFPDEVERMCQSLKVPPDRLELELTEGATQPLIKLMDTLTRFRIKGIGLALDDFGTGYSSLLQLRHLPFTNVKIDRAFVRDVEHATDCQLIVRTMIELAHGLGLTATAEGVENADQLNVLRALGCDLAQGYLISRPLQPSTMVDWQTRFKAEWAALLPERAVPPAH